MKLCNAPITVFNSRMDGENGYDKYYPTVIRGVSWYSEIVSTVDKSGLMAANKFTIRIPQNADFSGKSYIEPKEYGRADDVNGIFTLGQGDTVVLGAVTGENLKPQDLHKQYEAFTILGVTDNRRAPNAPHWKVVGK